MRHEELRKMLSTSERAPTVIEESEEDIYNSYGIDARVAVELTEEALFHQVGINDKDSHKELQRSARARYRRR